MSEAYFAAPEAIEPLILKLWEEHGNLLDILAATALGGTFERTFAGDGFRTPISVAIENYSFYHLLGSGVDSMTIYQPRFSETGRIDSAQPIAVLPSDRPLSFDPDPRRFISAEKAERRRTFGLRDSPLKGHPLADFGAYLSLGKITIADASSINQVKNGSTVSAQTFGHPSKERGPYLTQRDLEVTLNSVLHLLLTDENHNGEPPHTLSFDTASTGARSIKIRPGKGEDGPKLERLPATDASEVRVGIHEALVEIIQLREAVGRLLGPLTNPSAADADS